MEIQMAEETFKVDTEENTEDKTVKVEQDFDSPEEDDSIVLDTSTGKGLQNMEIPEKMRAPAFTVSASLSVVVITGG